MALERGECLLRDYRVAARMTQEDLSARISKRFGLEISSTMISHYENDRKSMSPVVLRACALIFKKNMDDFYTWPIT